MTAYYYDIIFKLARILSLTRDNRSSSYELEELTHDLSKLTVSRSFVREAGFAASTKIFVPKPSNIHIPSKVSCIGNMLFIQESFTPQVTFNDGMNFGLQFYIGIKKGELLSLRFWSEDQREAFFDLLLCSIALRS